MGIKTRYVEDHNFRGTIHTLTCERTGRKLANILVKKPNTDLDQDMYVMVRAISPFADNADSGTHRIGGLLAFGPVSEDESYRFPTIIEDIQWDDSQGIETATILVKELLK